MVCSLFNTSNLLTESDVNMQECTLANINILSYPELMFVANPTVSGGLHPMWWIRDEVNVPLGAGEGIADLIREACTVRMSMNTHESSVG